MDLSFLRPLYARPGPFACAYLDATGDGDRDVDAQTPAATVPRGWARMRERLVSEGADVATVGALAHVVTPGEPTASGRGMALFAAHGRLALAETLPERPGHDRATVTFVPDAMPLALQHAPDIRYTAVQVRRVHDAGGGSRLVAETQTGRWPHARVEPPERGVREAAAGEWRQEAAVLAAELAATADRGGSDVVVVAGDRWAATVLCEALPERLGERVVRIESKTRPARTRAAGTGRLLLEDELASLLDGRLSTRDRRHLDRFLEERARHGEDLGGLAAEGLAAEGLAGEGLAAEGLAGEGLAVEGLAATTRALRAGDVAVLLVDTPSELDRTRLWVGAATRQVGVARDDLEPLDASASWSAPADAAVLRALVGEGGELVAVPRRELPLTDGIGALLRG